MKKGLRRQQLDRVRRHVGVNRSPDEEGITTQNGTPP